MFQHQIHSEIMNNTQKEIGTKIKYMRENILKISQKELASNLKLDPTYVSRVESGKQNLTIETLEQFCKAFNFSLKEFFDYEL